MRDACSERELKNGHTKISGLAFFVAE